VGAGRTATEQREREGEEEGAVRGEDGEMGNRGARPESPRVKSGDRGGGGIVNRGQGEQKGQK